MSEFWRLISLLVSMMGFLITGGALLLRGESLLTAAIRAVIVFVVLLVVQNMLGSLMVAVSEMPSRTPIKPDDQQASRN